MMSLIRCRNISHTHPTVRCDVASAGVNVSYDEAFGTRVSADLKVRFGGVSTTALSKDVQQLPVINALTSPPSNRDVRVHDWGCGWYPEVDGKCIYPWS